MKRLWVVVPALLCGCLAAPVYAGDGVLSVGRVSGSASVNRLGSVEQVSPGDLLNERDVVQVGDDGQLELEFAGHGFVEIGPGAEVGIEKLPFASYSDDLKTIFNLTHGYLRVVWKLPDVAGSWPLFVYFGDQHARLEPGEYFFDSRAGVARACVAAGRMSVLANAGTEVQKLRPPVCYRFAAGLPAQEAEHDASTWISVRRNFDIDAPTSPEALLAVGDAGAVAGEGDAAPPAPKPKATAAAEPKPAPPPAPPHKPEAPAAGAEDWGINVASYAAADDAARQVQQLRSAGYPASVQQAQVRTQTWHRVQLRGYGSAAAARAAADELQTRFGYRGLWVVRNTPAGHPAAPEPAAAAAPEQPGHDTTTEAAAPR